MKYNNHLSMGIQDKIFKDKKVASSNNSSEFEMTLAHLNSSPRSIGTIPPGFEHRADLISDLFYGTPTFDWVVLWANNISDPFQQLNAGDRIVIVDLV